MRKTLRVSEKGLEYEADPKHREINLDHFGFNKDSIFLKVNGDKDKKEDKKDGDKDKKDEKGKEKDKPENKQGKNSKEEDKSKENGKPKPLPGGISQQRLENLLDAVNNEEKKIQEKVNAKKVKGKPMQTEKDW